MIYKIEFDPRMSAWTVDCLAAARMLNKNATVA